MEIHRRATALCTGLKSRKAAPSGIRELSRGLHRISFASTLNLLISVMISFRWTHAIKNKYKVVLITSFMLGYGRFHYLLLAVCGLVSTSEEMDVISMSFILPSAQCDLDLTTQTKVSYRSLT